MCYIIYVTICYTFKWKFLFTGSAVDVDFCKYLMEGGASWERVKV